MRGEGIKATTSAQLAGVLGLSAFLAYQAFPETDLAFLVAFAAVVGLSFLAVRLLFDRLTRKKPIRNDPRFAAPLDLLDGDRRDLVGLRIALERTVAHAFTAALEEASRGAGAGRAARIAKVLLGHRSAWRFVGVDATRPMPSERANEVFEHWCRDVRGRYGAPSQHDGNAFRWESLVLVSLHVASPGRVADVDVTDPSAAEQVLCALRDRTEQWATRVDLWTSPREFTAAELREADPTLLEVLDDDVTGRMARFEKKASGP
ncbi:MAG: hypothetical protein U0353_33990 [Sandaracinus sp.]